MTLVTRHFLVRWTWHDTDAPIRERLLGVPIGQDSRELLFLFHLSLQTPKLERPDYSSIIARLHSLGDHLLRFLPVPCFLFPPQVSFSSKDIIFENTMEAIIHCHVMIICCLFHSSFEITIILNFPEQALLSASPSGSSSSRCWPPPSCACRSPSPIVLLDKPSSHIDGAPPAVFFWESGPSHVQVFILLKYLLN